MLLIDSLKSRQYVETFRDRSLFIAGGADGGFQGGSLDFQENKSGGSVVTENPKEGSLKTLEGFRGRRGGGHLNLLEKGRHGGGGIAKVIKSYQGGSLQCSNIQRGDRLNFTQFSQKSKNPPSVFFVVQSVLKNKHSRRKDSVYFLLPKLTRFFMPSPDRITIKFLTFDNLKHFPQNRRFPAKMKLVHASSLA